MANLSNKNISDIIKVIHNSAKVINNYQDACNIYKIELNDVISELNSNGCDPVVKMMIKRIILCCERVSVSNSNGYYKQKYVAYESNVCRLINYLEK